MPKTFLKSNGEISNYDTNKYNATWYAKNKNKLVRKIIMCEYCNIELTQSNKSNHNKSKKHLLVVAYANKLANQQPEVIREALSSSNDASLVADMCELEIK
jgi:hypothetical protein